MSSMPPMTPMTEPIPMPTNPNHWTDEQLRDRWATLRKDGVRSAWVTFTAWVERTSKVNDAALGERCARWLRSHATSYHPTVVCSRCGRVRIGTRPAGWRRGVSGPECRVCVTTRIPIHALLDMPARLALRPVAWTDAMEEANG